MDDRKVSGMACKVCTWRHDRLYGYVSQVHAHRLSGQSAEVESWPSETSLALWRSTRCVPPGVEQHRPEALRSILMQEADDCQRWEAKNLLPIDLWWRQRCIRRLREEDFGQRRFLANLWQHPSFRRNARGHLWILDGNVHVGISISRHSEWLGTWSGRLP